MFTDLSPPPVEPVSLDETKLFLRVDHNVEDALITDLILSARQQIEHRANLVLISRSIRVSVRAKGVEARIPLHPVRELMGVAVDGEAIAAMLDSRPRPARIHLERAVHGLMDVDVVAGFGDTAAEVPVPIRQAILLLVADAYEHREREPGFERTSLRVDALLGPYWGPRL